MDDFSKKKLNILHLESSFGWGGQEIRILTESLSMRDLGYKVFFCIEKNGVLHKKALKNGFKSYEIRFKKFFWFFSFFKLLYIMKKYKIDIVNTHSSSDSWLGGVLAKLLKIKVVRTRHLSTTIRKGLNSRILYGFLADFVVTTCEEAASIIRVQANKDPKKCISIPTGVDLDKIIINSKETEEFKKLHNIGSKDFLVGMVCFMRSWKGVDDFLKAAKILENKKDIKFFIIGKGHIKTYQDLAKKLNLKNVIFTNHLENPYPAINALDVFSLLSTAHEGVSQASLQAAFLKKPLICTETGGLKEVCIDGVTGFQVPKFSPENVAEKILILKNDLKLAEKFGENAKKIALNFSKESMILQMQNVYLKIFN